MAIIGTYEDDVNQGIDPGATDTTSEQSSDLQQKLLEAMHLVREIVDQIYVMKVTPARPVILAALEELNSLRKQVDLAHRRNG